jgi:uncharacterized membrane protein YeaQ/YmgE (transglycosylase-associated protein family)
MPILEYLLVGLVAGAVARGVWKGPQPEGLPATLVIGMAGIAAGAAAATLTGVGEVVGAGSFATWITATTWACLLLAAYGGLVSGLRTIAARVTERPRAEA